MAIRTLKVKEMVYDFLKSLWKSFGPSVLKI